MNKVGTGVDITGTTTKAPTLKRTAKPSGDTWTDAASGAATTTKPTNTKPYIQIDADANTGTLTATPKVTSEGYGTTTQYGATAGTATVGAAAATTAYVPVTEGTAGTPSASKGAVSNHSISVTPSVTNATGWITGGTKTGTAVSVSASELVSGNKALTSSATAQNNIDVTNYATVSVAAISASAIDNSIISGSAFEEDTDDYAWRTTVTIPAGYHTAQTLTKDFSSVFPAPESEATSGQVLLGYELFDHDGKKITGTMPNNTTGGTISTQGGTYTIPAGYTAGGTVTANINAGSHSGTVSTHNISTVPVVTPSISGTVTNISSTSQPSGTNGTDYWTLDPDGSVTTTGKSTAKATATIGTAGYISTSSSESSADTKDITPTIAAGTNRYISKATSSTTQPTASATNGTASVTKQPSASASVTSNGIETTTTNTGFSVTASASSGSGTISATGGSASTTAGSVTVGVGYNPSAVTASVAASSASGTSASTTEATASDSKTLYIKAATHSETQPTASATAGTASIVNQPSASASTSVTGMVTTSTNTGYSVSASASANSGNSTATGGSASTTAGSLSVTTGYVGTAISTSVAAKSAYGNTVTSTAVDDSASDTKYIQAGVLSAADSSIDGSNFTPTITWSTNKFVFGGSSTVSGTAHAKVSTEGYVKANPNNTSKALSKTISATGDVDTVTLGASASGTVKVTPSISKQSVPSGVTDAAGGAATTTAPSSGVYVAVKSAASENTLTLNPSVSSDGYGTTGHYGTTAATNRQVSVGANASDVTYVPIKAATPAFDGGTPSASSYGATSVTLQAAADPDVDPGSGIYFYAKADRTAVLYNGAVNGWVSKADDAVASAAPYSASKKYYVTGVTVGENKSFPVNNSGTVYFPTNSGTVTVPVNKGTVTVGNNGTVNVSHIMLNGVIQGEVNVNAFPATGDTSTGSKNIVHEGRWNYQTIAAADTVYYGAVSAGAGSVSVSASKGTVSSNSVTVTPSYTNTAGYIPAHSTAQNGTAVTVSASELVSGNKELASGTSAQTNIDVTNYATVSISAIASGSVSTAASSNLSSFVSGTSTNYYVSATKSAGYISAGTDYVYLNVTESAVSWTGPTGSWPK